MDTWDRRTRVGNRRRFSREYKVEAVAQLEGGRRDVVEVARELGLRPDMLRKWRQAVAEEGQGAFPGSGGIRAGDEELVRLRREVRRLREEREILKKAVAILSDGQHR